MLRNWKFLLLVLVVNAIFSFIVLSPLSALIKSTLSDTLIPSQLENGFSFTLITEFIRIKSSALSISLNHFLLLLGLYFLWSIFYIGGFLGLINQSDSQNKLNSFWEGGATNFFKIFRLAIFVIMAIVLIICLFLLSFSNANLLTLESEMGLIRRSKYFLIFLAFFLFFIGIFKDLAKIMLSKSANKVISKTNMKSLRLSFTVPYILLGLLNLIFLAIGSIVFYLLNQVVGSFYIALFIAGQLFILYRIAYTFLRLSSFEAYYEAMKGDASVLTSV